ncbi:MAG: SGNH/GDSL hydrolase family protein [Endomicrobiaceae bacterium]|nr:SGNH/GDSL hydrolase family protein [Endomicrobiaceae bacterium]
MKSKRFWLHTGMFVAISFVFVFIALVITFFIDAFFYSTGYARSDGIWELSDSEVLVYEMKKKFDINNYNKNYDNFKTNSVGFRDYEFSETKERNIKRILVFGDSITVGTDSIEYSEDVYSKQLENIISKDKTLKYKYEVYNMGVDGYNTVQEAENLRLHVDKYKPDIVIVTYCLNDTDDYECGIYYQILSYLKLGKIGYFLTGSKLYKALCQILFDKINLQDKAKVEKKCDRYWGFEESDMNIPEKGFRMFDFLQKKYNFKLYVFIVPFMVDYNNYEYEKEHESVMSVLNNYNIKGFDMIKCFSDVSKDGSIFDSEIKDKIHPNEFGHKLMAEFMYKKLKAENTLN